MAYKGQASRATTLWSAEVCTCRGGRSHTESLRLGEENASATTFSPTVKIADTANPFHKLGVIGAGMRLPTLASLFVLMSPGPGIQGRRTVLIRKSYHPWKKPRGCAWASTSATDGIYCRPEPEPELEPKLEQTGE